MSSVAVTSAETTPAPAARVEVIDCPDEFAALAGEWDALDPEGAAPSFRASEQAAPSGADPILHLVLVRSPDGALVGLAPLMVARGVGGFPPDLRVLTWIDSQADAPCEERLLVRDGCEAEVVNAMALHLVKIQPYLWDVALLRRVRADSPCLPLLESALAASGLRVERRRTSSARARVDILVHGRGPAARSYRFRTRIKRALARVPGLSWLATRLGGAQ